ncbi:hypothetical protein Hanom_Chr15g01381141 [Helianthus anomalus]
MNSNEQSSDVRFELLILKPHHILRFIAALNLRRTEVQRNSADEVDVNVGIVNAVKRRFEVAGECRFKEAVRDVGLVVDGENLLFCGEETGASAGVNEHHHLRRVGLLCLHTLCVCARQLVIYWRSLFVCFSL